MSCFRVVLFRLGSHVTILTNAYEELLKNVNEMINSNAVVRDMNELMRCSMAKPSRSGKQGTGGTALRAESRALSKAGRAAGGMARAASLVLLRGRGGIVRGNWLESARCAL